MAEKKTTKKSSAKKAPAVEKKTTKKSSAKKAPAVEKKTKANTSKSKNIVTKSKTKKIKDEPLGDMGIVIVDDDITIDQEKVNEERRAYLEEARSQEAFD